MESLGLVWLLGLYVWYGLGWGMDKDDLESVLNTDLWDDRDGVKDSFD